MVILGAGESGTGAAVLGVTQNWDVFVSDRGKIAPKYQDELNIHNIAWEQEQHTEEKILGADLIIKSPGIPDKAPLVVAAKAKGMVVIGLTGKDGGKMASLCDVEIRAPHSEFADRAQEIHIKVIHALIDSIEVGLGYSK